MSSKRATRDLARSLRRFGKRNVDYHVRKPQYATIIETSPMSVELHEGAVILEDDDLSLSQMVKWYDMNIGIDSGDTAVVHEMHDGHWLVQDILSDKAIPEP